MRIYKVGIGQDSHRFSLDKNIPCMIAGLVFPEEAGLEGDSDADVVLHAICNAISSITHVPILGKVAIELCHKMHIRDSAVYLEKALETLGSYKIEHVAITIEGKRPKFQMRCDEMRKSVAKLMHLTDDQVGMTFTSGDYLTDFARGDGLMSYCLLTVYKGS